MIPALQPMYTWIACGACGVATAIAAYTDATTGHIPNWITFPVIGAGILVCVLAFGWDGAQFSLLGAAVCFGMPYLMFRAGGMGGGDVKLFAGLGAFLGLRLGLEVELASMCIGAAWAVLKLARKGRLGAMLKNSLRVGTNWALPAKMQTPIDTSASDTLRLGVPIFVGTVGVLAYRVGAAQ